MREKFENYRTLFIAVGSSLLVLLLAGLLLFNTNKREKEPEEWLNASSEPDTVEISDSSETPKTVMYVDVKGAIHSPGIYTIDSDMRVWDVLVLAGGMTDQADEKQINLSQKVQDQMVIYVPTIGEEGVFSVPDLTAGQEEKDPEKTGKINLNTATEQELMTLSGIGQKKAQEIISYREESGGFTSVEELTNISGFGEKTVEKMRDSVYVS